MKKATTVTRKGQVTIPLVVREKLDIKYEDKVEFVFDEQGQVYLSPIKTDIGPLYGILKILAVKVRYELGSGNH